MTDAATYHRGQRNFGTGYDMIDQIEALEAKLAKAVEALDHIAAEASVPVRTKKKGGIKHKWMYRGWRKIAVERIDIARTTLAEIKGESHDPL